MGTEIQVIMSNLSNYLPLAGGTMTGDIQMGANKLKTTNLTLEQNTAVCWATRITAVGYGDIRVRTLNPEIAVDFANATTGYIKARNTDGNNVVIQSRKNGVGLVDIAQFVGAADPYFQATLPMRLNPTANALPSVEGMIGYNSGDDTFRLRRAADEVTFEFPPDFAAGDNLLISEDTEESTTNAAYTKLKEFYCPHAGTLRIKFDLDAVTVMSYGRIYRNGNAVGTEQSENGTGYVTKSEDIAGWSRGDLIQLYLYSNAGGGTAKCQNFRIYADIGGYEFLVTG